MSTYVSLRQKNVRMIGKIMSFPAQERLPHLSIPNMQPRILCTSCPNCINAQPKSKRRHTILFGAATSAAKKAIAESVCPSTARYKSR